MVECILKLCLLLLLGICWKSEMAEVYYDVDGEVQKKVSLNSIVSYYVYGNAAVSPLNL